MPSTHRILGFRLPSLRAIRPFRGKETARAVGARGLPWRIVLWFVVAGVAFASDRPVDPTLAQNAVVVLQGRRLLAPHESGDHRWHEVEVLEVFENRARQIFSFAPIEVAAHRGDAGVPVGVSTLYLERMEPPDRNRWQLVGGSAKRGVSHAAPRETMSRLAFALTCFLHEVDAPGFCRTTFTPTPGAHPVERLSGGQTCGRASEVSEIKWEFLGREGDADLYQVTRRFPADAPQSETVAKKVKFEGKRVVVFRDKHHIVVLDPIAAAAKR